MIICDQGGCTARATREIWLDNGFELWACAHHAADWYSVPADIRFREEPLTIFT